jgi:cysteine synthase
MTDIKASVIDVIGNTPLVDLSRITAHLGLEGRILAKLDNLLPGYSKKDRAARQIIEAARADGRLKSGQSVVELTSGNMGTGLAIVCGVLGHPFTAVMSAGNSTERARMMRGLGAEVVIVPQASGGFSGQVTAADLEEVDQEVRRITEQTGAFRADQFEDPGNPAGHETGTGPELWAQSGGTVTAFCDFAGSGGTLAGVAQALAPKGVRCYAVEPAGAEVIAGHPVSDPNHPIQGGGYAMAELTHLEAINIAGTLAVTGPEARDAARMLAQPEGVFGGYSAGANLAAAIALLRGAERGGTVAMIVCDSGLKYLSTDLWEDQNDHQ